MARAPPSDFRAPPVRLRHAAVAIGVLLFLLIALDLQFDGALSRLDEWVGQWVQDHLASDTRAFFHSYGSSLGHDEVSWPLLILVSLVIAWKDRWRTAALMVGSGFLAGLVWWTLKAFFATDRPDVALGGADWAGRSASFPSGHTMKAIVVYGLILYFAVYAWVSRTRTDPRPFILPATVVWLLITLVVSAARVLSGHHWPSDVVATWSLGLAWLSLTITLHERWVRPFEQLAAGRQPTNEAVL